MIEKMTFLTVTGPRDDIDRVTEKYLKKYEFQPENAATEIKNAGQLTPFSDENPYKRETEDIKIIIKEYGNIIAENASEKTVSLEEALATARDIRENLNTLFEKKSELHKTEECYSVSYKKIIPFKDLDYDLSKVLNFKNVKFSFGRMPLEYYSKFMDYAYKDTDVLLFECTRDEDFVWLVYFTPKQCEDKTDAVFASMYFEKIFIPDEYIGSPLEAIENLHSKIKSVQEEIFKYDMEIAEYLRKRGSDIIAGEKRLSDFAVSFDIRKYSAYTKHTGHSFYILCGWMSESDAKSFMEDIKDDEKVFGFLENDMKKLGTKPPTKLIHKGILKPFEMFTRMYGLPDYNELDPTPVLALTYSVFFGFMFGDLGQGALLCIGGFLLYKLKKLSLGGIISLCGVFSMLFGVLFGSVFGFEDVIDAVWLKPQEAMTNLPFIGNLNTVFAAAVLIGMIIIIFTMVLNIINAAKQGDKGRLLFDTNGVAGLVFYSSLVAAIVSFMLGKSIISGLFILILMIVPLVVIFFKEPLENAIDGKKQLIEGGVGMFITQGIFELFEVMLSFFSNTLSFVRIGAFAVSHAAMMGVVMMLAGAENGGDINIIAVILGNLFVCGMEGLIVGIQVLRLEYYELFSRFYKGTGREFRPYGRVEKSKV